MIGASNLVRFALRYAEGCPSVCKYSVNVRMLYFLLALYLIFSDISGSAKRVGLCVSGMTAGKCSAVPINVVGIDFLHKTNCCGEKCLILLGTNDALLAGRFGSVRVSVFSLFVLFSKNYL